MRRSVLLVLFAFACKSKSATPPVVASGSAPSIVDAGDASLAGALADIAKRNDLPAVAAAAWRDGKQLDRAWFGVTKSGGTTKIAADAQWHLGSNTKAMTALLIGIYVDKGALRWTDTIGQTFTGMKIDPGYKNVTLDQLIRHEGGAPAHEPLAVWSQLRLDADKPDARITYVRGILEQPPAQAPGTFVYANASYIIAGAMLEKKTGKRWDDLIQSEVFDKLDMKSCGFGAPTGDNPWGHGADGKPVEPGPLADNPPGLGPAGTVHCSLDDYGKFLNVPATGQPAIVTPETMQHLRTPRGDKGYAGGWMVLNMGQATVLAHSGSNTMWYASAFVIPEKKFAFAIATNKYEPKLENELLALLMRFSAK
jgi:D-alanyl-D-alanine carboxypeptidase